MHHHILKPLRAMSTLPHKIQTAACLIIGDEVLNGKIKDTNSNYFAKFCFNLGIDLHRVTVCPDEEEDIVSELNRLKKYDLVLTSGGIGPTHDDITYEAVAKSYGMGLKKDPETEDKMNLLGKRKPKDLPPDIRSAQLKMATFPDGPNVERHFLCNDLWVPVVSVESKVYILPGIPQLFQRLLDGLEPQIVQRAVCEAKKRRFISTKTPESEMAKPLSDAQAEFAELGYKLGSYPHMKLGRNTVSVIGPNNEPRFDELMQRLLKAVDGHEISAEEEYSASFE